MFATGGRSRGGRRWCWVGSTPGMSRRRRWDRACPRSPGTSCIPSGTSARRWRRTRRQGSSWAASRRHRCTGSSRPHSTSLALWYLPNRHTGRTLPHSARSAGSARARSRNRAHRWRAHRSHRGTRPSRSGSDTHPYDYASARLDSHPARRQLGGRAPPCQRPRALRGSHGAFAARRLSEPGCQNAGLPKQSGLQLRDARATDSPTGSDSPRTSSRGRNSRRCQR